jgi:hypothetical protein
VEILTNHSSDEIATLWRLLSNQRGPAGKNFPSVKALQGEQGVITSLSQLLQWQSQRRARARVAENNKFQSPTHKGEVNEAKVSFAVRWAFVDLDVPGHRVLDLNGGAGGSAGR